MKREDELLDWWVSVCERSSKRMSKGQVKVLLREFEFELSRIKCLENMLQWKIKDLKGILNLEEK